MQPRLARRSRSVITVSKFSAAEIKTVLQPGPRRIDIVPNGGDHILRVPSDRGVLSRHGLEERGFLLAVGSANPTKNLGILSSLEDLLRDAGLKLAIAGGKVDRVFGTQESLRSDVILPLGFVSDRELRGLYEAALGLVFPSIYEGFGIPPIEAMFCGCPVIASSAASVPEICADAARYFNPHDPDDLVRVVSEFIHSQEMRNELIAAGHARANRFTWKRAAEAFTSALEL
jgi:glycosyltransferase involved in cell wall biosynthesis